jgi:surface protein
MSLRRSKVGAGWWTVISQGARQLSPAHSAILHVRITSHGSTPGICKTVLCPLAFVTSSPARFQGILTPQSLRRIYVVQTVRMLAHRAEWCARLLRRRRAGVVSVVHFAIVVAMCLCSVVFAVALCAVASIAAGVPVCSGNGNASFIAVAVASLSFQAQMPSTQDVTYSNFPLQSNVPVEVSSSKKQPAAIATNSHVGGEPPFFSTVTSATTRVLTFTLPRLAGVVITPASWIPAELAGTLGSKSFVLPSISKQKDVFTLGVRPHRISVDAQAEGVGVELRLFVPSTAWESGDYVRIRIGINGAATQLAAFYRWTALQDMRGQWTLVTATVPLPSQGAQDVELQVFIDFVGTEATEFVAVSDVTTVRVHTECLCLPGFVGEQCEALDGCVSSPCENGATCRSGSSGFTCTCAPGFTGMRCESDVNECSSSPCRNGGTCSNGVNGYTCVCAPGFSGTFCELSACSSSPCRFGAVCSASSSSKRPFVCSTFVTRWNTTRTSSGSSTAAQIQLPLEAGGTYNFVVQWGDGTSETITASSQALHTYSAAGVYNVTITGTLLRWRFGNSGDRLKLLDVMQWGTMRLGNNGFYFWGASNMVMSAVDTPDLTGTTNMQSMFHDASSFNQPIGGWDVSRVTNMQNMFAGAFSFNQPIGGWNVSSATNMVGMFQSASSFNQPIGGWDVSSVTTMYFDVRLCIIVQPADRRMGCVECD